MTKRPGPAREIANEVAAGPRRAVGMLVVTLVVVGAFATLAPTNGVPTCLFRSVTGLDCPLCGGTRAMHALLQGQVFEALDRNALVVLLVPVAIGVLMWAFVAVWRGASIADLRIAPSPAIVFAAVSAAFWVTRNLPAFRYLRSS